MAHKKDSDIVIFISTFAHFFLKLEIHKHEKAISTNNNKVVCEFQNFLQNVGWCTIELNRSSVRLS